MLVVLLAWLYCVKVPGAVKTMYRNTSQQEAATGTHSTHSAVQSLSARVTDAILTSTASYQLASPAAGAGTEAVTGTQHRSTAGREAANPAGDAGTLLTNDSDSVQHQQRQVCM